MRLSITGGALFMEQLAEDRVNIFLIANMLHCKILKRRLQMLILAPQRLVGAAGDFDIAVVKIGRAHV